MDEKKNYYREVKGSGGREGLLFTTEKAEKAETKLRIEWKSGRVEAACNRLKSESSL